MEQIAAFTLAARDLLAWALLQPAAADNAGGFVGGYTIGVAKNKTAFVELFRGVVAGVAAGALVTLVQLVIVGGGA